MSRFCVRLLLFILIFGALSARYAVGCSCGVLTEVPGSCKNVKAAGLSFVGTVLDIDNPADERRGADQSGLSRYHFRVDENFNGFAQKEVDIYSGRGGGDCSVHFRPGESYLVTPYWAPATGQLTAGICTYTRSLSSAGQLIAELRARKNGALVTGVVKSKYEPVDYYHGVRDATIELRGNGIARTTQTNDSGTYRFDGIPAGTYQLTVKLPADLRRAKFPPDSTPPLTVVAQPCYEQNFRAEMLLDSDDEPPDLK